MINNGVVGDWRLSDEEFLRTFQLPSAQDKTETLRATNPLSNDSRIVFDEEAHTYTLDGLLVPLSVTALVDEFCHDFNPGDAILGMRPDTKEKYAEQGLMTEKAIIASWNRNGEVQRNRGTLMHYHIEQFLNGCAIEEPQSPEFQQFAQLFQRIAMDQRVFRTELSVFSSQLNVAGQIDALFLRTDGTFALWDWKRSKLVSVFFLSIQVPHCPEQTMTLTAMEYNSKINDLQLRYDSRTPMKEPLDHLPDTNYYRYALQLNIYRFILQSEHSMTVNALFLGICHPSRSEPLCVQLPLMDDEMHALLEYRNSQ